MTVDSIAQRLTRIRERIERAAQRSGRLASDITVVAVTKHVNPPAIEQAIAAGILDFGESYVQEALAKLQDDRLRAQNVRWHLIGHLQSNKVKDVVNRFDLVHSVDSIPLARELGKRACQLGHEAAILLQVRLDPGNLKFGIAVDDTMRVYDAVRDIAGINVRGLMGIAPYFERSEDARPYFRALRSLYGSLPPESQQVLSMGMTADFETAIDEGSNLVRIGTGIFGPRSGSLN